MASASAPIEDFLEVDKPIPGQNFVCLSFVSPDKVLVQKEKFTFYKYTQDRVNTVSTALIGQLEEMLSKATDNTIDIAQIVRFKKFVDAQLKADKTDIAGFNEKYEDFLFKEGKVIQAEFDESHNFQTNVRGIKVRGVYDTYKEADMRAKVLQRMDQSFHVYVGQVGYWLPWDPNSNDVENQEYLDDQLNRLVKEYKENEVKKDIFYQEQKTSRKKEAMSVADRLRKKLADKKSQAQTQTQTQSEAGSGAEPLENNTNETDLAQQLSKDDPWMQRKTAEAAATASEENQ
jgi:hypothetical protein